MTNPKPREATPHATLTRAAKTEPVKRVALSGALRTAPAPSFIPVGTAFARVLESVKP